MPTDFQTRLSRIALEISSRLSIFMLGFNVLFILDIAFYYTSYILVYILHVIQPIWL